MTSQIRTLPIGAAIEVHRDKGPGLIGTIYEWCLLVEAKSGERVLPIHKAQLLSYMKLMNVPPGLLINFHEPKLIDGVSRPILPGADS